MKKQKIIKEPAVFILCRVCGLEYVEARDWMMRFPGESECPHCKNILKLL
jgi:hypothetical protein